MNALRLLAALLTVLGSGFAALVLITPKPMRLNLAERFALSWLCGTGVVSLLIWVLGFFVHGALLIASTAFVCAILFFAAWKKGNSFTLRCSWGRALKPVELFLAAFVALEIALIFYLSYVHTLGWDGLFNWEIKARYAFANGGVLPATYLQSEGRSFSHPEYPLAIPFTELWVYLWLGETNQFWVKAIFPMFYAAGAVLLAALGARLSGQNATGLVSAILLFFVPQIVTGGGSAIVGYADFPLSVFYLATIGYLLLACRTDDDGSSFRIYAVCLALLPWVKREGIILWLVAALCGALVIWRRKESRLHLLALLPGAFVIVAWQLYLSRMHAFSNPEFLPLSFATLHSNLYRIAPIMSALVSEFFDIQTWGLFWLLVLLGSGYFLRKYRDIRALVFFSAILLPCALYAFAYVFSSWPDYLKHIGFSISRLLMHIAPLSFLAVSIALARRLPESVRSRDRVALATCVSQHPQQTAEVECAGMIS